MLDMRNGIDEQKTKVKSPRRQALLVLASVLPQGICRCKFILAGMFSLMQRQVFSNH